MRRTVIILCAVIGLTSGAGVLPEDSVNAAVGGSVTFTTSLTPTGTTLNFIAWNKGITNILTSVAGGVSIDPEYKHRVTLNVSTGSLELRNLTVSDTGEYGVTIRPTAGDASITGEATLNVVYENITNISVASSSNLPVEGTSVNLTCDASGSIFTREWMINGVELKPSENFVFYEEKRVLSFRNLTRKDSGRYTCRISNAVSSQSEDYTMNVNYGPDRVQISGLWKVPEGSTLKLNCSAESVPPAKYTWTKNGTTLGQSHEYTKDNIKLSDSGEYICRAANDITMKSSQGSHTVNVTEASKNHQKNDLSTGAVIGITVASLVAVAAAAAGAFYMFKHKKDRKQKNKNQELENVYENTPNTGNLNTDDKDTHVYENIQDIYDRNM